MVQALSRLLNQIKSQDDESILAQRSSHDRGAALRTVLKQLLRKTKAQTSQGTIPEAQDDKIALAQLYIHLLESKVQKQDHNMSDEDMMLESPDDALAQLYLSLLKKEVQRQGFSEENRAKIESIFDSIKNKFTNFGKKIKNGFTSFGEKVKNFFHGR